MFYSAYVPVVENTLLPALDTKPPLLREHRLYQADWLLRFYGFRANELLDDNAPDFDPALDPKCCWALRHPEFFPVEVNRADYEALLRVPGIGVVSAKRILVARRSGALRAEDLKKLGVVMKRAQYFLTCGGRYASPLKLSQEGICKSDGRGAPRAPTGRGTAAIPFRSGRLRRPLWHGARSSINTTAALKGSSAACLKATQKRTPHRDFARWGRRALSF